MNTCLSLLCKFSPVLEYHTWAQLQSLTSIPPNSGTSAHLVKVFDFDGHELSRIEPYSSFLQGHKGTPISATAFHPHRMVLGCAARGDYHVNLFACGNEKVGPF